MRLCLSLLAKNQDLQLDNLRRACRAEKWVRLVGVPCMLALTVILHSHCTQQACNDGMETGRHAGSEAGQLDGRRALKKPVTAR